MARTVANVDGYKEMLTALRGMKSSMAGKHLLKSVLPAAVIVRDAASALAARSQTPKAVGHLADNIKIKVERRGKTRASVLVGPSSEHFWGLFLEYGTAKMPAQPFLRPALDNNDVRAVSVISFELKARLLDNVEVINK